MADNVALHPIVKELQKSFVVKDGELVMSAEDAEKHLRAVQAVSGPDKQTVAEHLVALAHRFKEQAGKTAEGSIALLIAYTVALLGEGAQQKASDLFAAVGLGKEAAAAIGGAQGVKAPRAEETARGQPPVVKAKRGLKK